MNVLLAVLGLPFVLVLPGWVTWVALAPGPATVRAETSATKQPAAAGTSDWLERAYLVLAVSLALSGWVGLILAQVGIFSAGLLVGLLALYTLVVGFVGWRKGRWAWARRPLLAPLREEVPPARSPERAVAGVGRGGRPRRTPGPWKWARANSCALLFLLLSALFVGLAFRPFELILGPRDAAVYPATAAQIAAHGSIRIADPILTTLPDPALSDENNRLWTSLILLQSAGRFYYHYLRMPGFFIAEADVEAGVTIPQGIPDADKGVVVPQFYYLYPTWLAIAFSLVGIQFGLLMTPYLSFLGGVGVFLVARRLFGAPAALLAGLLLNLNVLQVWFARYSTAEGATQFLLFLCLYGLVRLEEGEESRREPYWGLLAGAALGMVGLVRVEFIFPWALFLPYLAYLFVTRGVRRGHRYLLLALGVLVAHTVVQFITHTRGYTLGIYYHRIQDWFTLSWLAYPFMTPTLRLYFYESATSRTLVMKQPWRLLYELGAPLLLGAALVALRRRPALVQRLGAWLRRHGRLLLAAAAALLLLGLAYTYLVRPGILRPEVLLHPLENSMAWQGYIGAPVPEGRAANLVRLGWYFSPLGMALAFAGIALLVARESSRRTWFLTLLGLFYLFLFTYETFGQDHHVYIMRRYVAAVVPFFSIAMGYAVAWLGRWLPAGGRPAEAEGIRPETGLAGSTERALLRVRRAAAALLAAALVVYLAYTGLPFFRHDEYAGALGQVAALAERFDPDDVILAVGAGRDNSFTIVTPLRFLFERNAFGIVSSEPNGALLEEQIRRWQAEGRRVYLLAGNDGGRLFLPHTRLQWLERFELAVPEFEQLTAQKPHNSYTLRQPWGLYEPVSWTGTGSALADLPLEIDMGSGGYVFQAGGFYGDEADPDGTTYCWTAGRGTLRLPWPREGAVTLALRLAGGKRPAELGPANVQLQGEQYLFDVSLDAAAGLDQGEVSAGLREQFQAAGRALSPQAPGVEIRQAGQSWVVVDEAARYLIRNGGQALAVYAEQVLGSWDLEAAFTTHTLVVPAEAITADESGTVLLAIVSPVWKQVDYGLGSDARPLGVEMDWIRVGRGTR